MMEVQLTDDQRMIRDSVAGYLRDRYDDAERRRIIDSEAGWSAPHWQAFANELGLLGAGFAESHGGLGGGAAEHALILEEFGSALVVEPFLSTAVIGGGFLKASNAAVAPQLIADAIAGKAIIAYAAGEPEARSNPAHVATRAECRGADYVIDGAKAVVLGAVSATHLIVVTRTAGGDRDRDGISVFVVDVSLPGITRRDYRTISGGPASDITFAGVTVPASALLLPEGAALPVIERIIDEATALLCAEANGVMRRLHGDTLAYTSQREQFGKPLASFQVLQHRMVDMLVAMEHSASITARAIEALDADANERGRAVSAAKVYVGKSLRFIGQQAIQLHGGMGMTDELAVGFFFKRAIEIERQFGSVDYHLTRYTRLAYAPAAIAA